MKKDVTYDLLGIGIGPSNLSVAALLAPLRDIHALFCDAKEQFGWHSGLLFPDATIQVSFLKDLVTLADPTSRFSFVSFLFDTKRLYRFLTSNFTRVSRVEFNQYMQWICDSLPNLRFGSHINTIDHDGDSFLICAKNETLQAKNIVLGTGLSPALPDCAKEHLGSKNVIVAVDFLKSDLRTRGLRIAVVGGGQTGAEIVSYLLSDPSGLPRELSWISRRANFSPLDESPFANELFTPDYSDYFFKLSAEQKSKLLSEQKLASDGIYFDLLQSIYRTVYKLEFLHGHGRICNFKPNCELVAMERDGGECILTLRHAIHDQMECLPVDLVILSTGFEYRMPSFLEPLNGRIGWGPDGYMIRDDFSIEWDGPRDQKIYVQNAARRQRGIADPNLSLMPWRSAKIINSLLKRTIYDVSDARSLFDVEMVQLGQQAVGGAI